MVAARNARLEIIQLSRKLERGIPPSDVQLPKDPFPLAAKPQEGEDVAARCLRLRKPELRRMGVKDKNNLRRMGVEDKSKKPAPFGAGFP